MVAIVQRNEEGWNVVIVVVTVNWSRNVFFACLFGIKQHKKRKKNQPKRFLSCNGCNCPLSVRHLNGNNSQPVHWFCNDVCTWRHSEIPYFILFAVFVDDIVDFFFAFFGIVFALLFTFSQLIGCNDDVFCAFVDSSLWLGVSLLVSESLQRSRCLLQLYFIFENCQYPLHKQPLHTAI